MNHRQLFQIPSDLEKAATAPASSTSGSFSAFSVSEASSTRTEKLGSTTSTRAQPQQIDCETLPIDRPLMSPLTCPIPLGWDRHQNDLSLYAVNRTFGCTQVVELEKHQLLAPSENTDREHRYVRGQFSSTYQVPNHEKNSIEPVFEARRNSQTAVVSYGQTNLQTPGLLLPYNEFYNAESTSPADDQFTVHLEFPMALTSSSITSFLLCHYARHMLCLMQPVYHRMSPFKTVYLPTALNGTPNLNVTRNSYQVSNAATAVFHGVLASAAANLQGLYGNNRRFRDLFCHHKYFALLAARKALIDGRSTYKELMTAILCLVSVDVGFS